jgi:hypothetical protein
MRTTASGSRRCDCSRPRKYLLRIADQLQAELQLVEYWDTLHSPGEVGTPTQHLIQRENSLGWRVTLDSGKQVRAP